MDDDAAGPAKGAHLVLVHGGGVGPWMWRAQQEHFGGSHRVHAPALPGHDPARHDTCTTHPRAAQAIARRIGLDELEGEVTVVGFSAGGQVAVELAAAFPARVTRTVLVSSLVQPWPAAARLPGWPAPLARREGFVRVQARQLEIPEEDFEAYFALSRVISTRTLTNLVRANFSFRPPERFLCSRRPVLLLAGAREHRRLVAGMRQVAGHLHDGRAEVLAGAGHGMPFARSAPFNDVLGSWLASNRT